MEKLYYITTEDPECLNSYDYIGDVVRTKPTKEDIIREFMKEDMGWTTVKIVSEETHRLTTEYTLKLRGADFACTLYLRITEITVDDTWIAR